MGKYEHKEITNTGSQNKQCKFGTNCFRKDCKYKHSIERNKVINAHILNIQKDVRYKTILCNNYMYIGYCVYG